MYEKTGQWSSYSISKSKTGFIVSFISQISGEIDGRKVLIPFAIAQACGIDKTTDLHAPYNEHMDNGEFIATTLSIADDARLLSCGQIVE